MQNIHVYYHGVKQAVLSMNKTGNIERAAPEVTYNILVERNVRLA